MKLLTKPENLSSHRVGRLGNMGAEMFLQEGLRFHHQSQKQGERTHTSLTFHTLKRTGCT